MAGPRGTTRVYAFARRLIPARVDRVILRIRRAQGRAEAQEGNAAQFAHLGAPLPLALLLQCLGPHVGGIELREARLDAEVRGCGVVEEAVRCGHDAVVERDHRCQRCRAARGYVGRGLHATEVGQVVKAPLQRPFHAIFIARGEGRLPRIHPLCIKPVKHLSSLAGQRRGPAVANRYRRACKRARSVGARESTRKRIACTGVPDWFTLPPRPRRIFVPWPHLPIEAPRSSSGHRRQPRSTGSSTSVATPMACTVRRPPLSWPAASRNWKVRATPSSHRAARQPSA